MGIVEPTTPYSGLVVKHVDSGLVHAVICLVVLSFCVTVLATQQVPGSLRSRALVTSLSVDKRRAAHICLVLGIVLILLAIALHGGLLSYLGQLGQIRAGRSSNLDRLGAFAMSIGRYLAFWSILILLTNAFVGGSKAQYLKVILMSSVVIAIGMLSGGRFLLLTLLIGLMISWALCKRRVPWVVAFSGIAFSVFLGGVGKALLYSNIAGGVDLWRDSLFFYFEETVAYLTFPFFNVVNLNLHDWPMRFGIDVFAWYMKYTRFFGVEFQQFDNSTYFNTWLITGDWESNFPPGLVGFSFLLAGVGGLVLIPSLLVIIARRVERLIVSARTPFGIALGSILYMELFGKMVLYSEIASLLQNFIPLILAISIYYVFSNARIKSR